MINELFTYLIYLFNSIKIFLVIKHGNDTYILCHYKLVKLIYLYTSKYQH